MSALLFLIDVAAIVSIALWLWGVEHSGEGWRVRLFDMQGQDGAEAKAATPAQPRWKGPKSGMLRRVSPATPSSTPPRWRRGVENKPMRVGRVLASGNRRFYGTAAITPFNSRNDDKAVHTQPPFGVQGEGGAFGD